MIIVRQPQFRHNDSNSSVAQSFPFGLLAEGWLRKHGWVSVRTISGPSDVGKGFFVHPRPTHEDEPVDPDLPGLFDGPPSNATLTALGLTARRHSTRRLEVFDADRRPLGRVCYPRVEVRAIPHERPKGIRPDPVLFEAPDPRWNTDRVDYASFEPTGGWEPVLWARPDDSSDTPAIIAVTNGTHLMLGAPLIEIAVASTTFVPLTDGYWAHRDSPNCFAIEEVLAERIGSLLQASGVTGVRIGRWPSEYTAALTIRHDYDRLIDDDTLDVLLARYDELGVRSSWGFLVHQSLRHHADRLEALGHEVMLHSIAGSEQELRNEIERLEHETGRRAAGSTAHGGIGAAGYLGQHHFEWAESVDFLHAELLGRSIGLPTQAPIVRGGIPALSSIVLPNTHFSLDLNTKPQGHALNLLRDRLPKRLAAGQHAVVMNHPDIHRDELLALLSEIDRSDIWPVTLRDLALWSRVAKFEAAVSDDNATIEFSAPLPHATGVERIEPDGRRLRWTIPAGVSFFSLAAANDQTESHV